MFKGKRILFVDDDDNFRNDVASYLSQQGFFVYPKSNLEQFKASLDQDKPDIVLIDKEIGLSDGFDLIHEVRKHNRYGNLPIIVISGCSDIDSKKQAIVMGADDFLAKPIILAELELRIIANLRRSKSYHLSDHILSFNEIQIDLRKHEVKINDILLSLTRTEYKIFLELLSKRGNIINREQIAQRFLSVRNSNDRTLDVHINSLRKKLGHFSSCVKTIRGRGYMFHYDL